MTAEDPDRFSAYAHNRSDTSPVIGHAELTGFNHYFGWYYGTDADFAPWADNLRATQPSRAFGLSEYGAGASVVQHEQLPAAQPAPSGKWHPEEYQAQFHEVYWKAIAARPFLWGTFVWNMFDFAVDSRDEGDTPGRNDKGLVTYDRATRKDAFYWYKANWTSTPFVHLTSARFTARTQTTTTVKVYGTVDGAVLSVNGVPVGGTRTSADHIYTWPNVTLNRGVNTVIVTGARNGTTYTDSATWTVS
jgi:beta-galactosidase